MIISAFYFPEFYSIKLKISEYTSCFLGPKVMFFLSGPQFKLIKLSWGKLCVKNTE